MIKTCMHAGAQTHTAHTLHTTLDTHCIHTLHIHNADTHQAVLDNLSCTQGSDKSVSFFFFLFSSRVD